MSADFSKSSVDFSNPPVRQGAVIQWTGRDGEVPATVESLVTIAGVWVAYVRIGDERGSCVITDDLKVIQVNLPEARLAAHRIVRGVSHTAVEREVQLVASAFLALLGGITDAS